MYASSYLHQIQLHIPDCYFLKELMLVQSLAVYGVQRDSSSYVYSTSSNQGYWHLHCCSA